jgi:hypothetical protein
VACLLISGLLTLLLTRAFDGLGEDVPDTRRVLAQDMGVDPQGHGRAGVAEPGGDYVDRDARQKQRGRVRVTKIMQAGVRERLGRSGCRRMGLTVRQLPSGPRTIGRRSRNKRTRSSTAATDGVPAHERTGRQPGPGRARDR